MGKQEKFWALISIFVIFLAYILPYTLLSDVPKATGSFLLWVLLGVVIIVINFIMTKDWRS